MKNNMVKNENKKMLKILIIEDQSSDIIGPYTLLKHYGQKVEVVNDGASGVCKLINEHFDLLILDWNIPHINGRELLECFEIRKLNNKIPEIIIYSGEFLNFNSFSNFKCIKFIDIWHKPLDPLELLRKVKSITNIGEKNEKCSGF